jgi:GTP cyclohydrolase I
LKKEIDVKAIEEHVKGIITALGGDLNREGLIETPERVSRMCAEIFEGMLYSNEEIAQMFCKSFENGDNASVSGEGMVILRDIDAFSVCEHHLALMYGMKITVAYIPGERLPGLSKIARIADMAARRLQLQERLGKDIADIVAMAAGTEDVAVIVKAYHSCLTLRGIAKPSAETVTTELRGRFRTDADMGNKLLSLVN